MTYRITVGGWANPGPTEAQEAVRAKACTMGADAVIVSREFNGGDMVGTAIKFGEAANPQALPEAR